MTKFSSEMFFFNDALGFSIVKKYDVRHYFVTLYSNHLVGDASDSVLIQKRLEVSAKQNISFVFFAPSHTRNGEIRRPERST